MLTLPTRTMQNESCAPGTWTPRSSSAPSPWLMGPGVKSKMREYQSSDRCRSLTVTPT